MGSQIASEFAELVANQDIALDTALLYHLTANHYPPVPRSMIQPCKLAIQAVNEGDGERMIELPAGVYYKYEGNTTAPAWAIVEGHHLDAFTNQEGE